MSKLKSFLYTTVLMTVVAVFPAACGDDEPEGEGGTDPCADGSCDSETESETATDTAEADTLDPIRYEDDQYGNPDAECDPQPEEIALTAEITDDGAWVAQCENRFGLQGAWFSYTDNDDGGNSEITMDYSEAEDGRICASGIGGLVWYEDFGKYWGAGFGVDICTMGTEEERIEGTLEDCTLYDDRTKIIGFRITVDGDEIPSGPDGADPQFRVQFSEVGRTESTYIVVDGPGTADYLFEDALVHYAVDRGDTDVPPIDSDKIKALQFQISTVEEVDTPFHVCVSDIKPILE